jgi:hypothetical protein
VERTFHHHASPLHGITVAVDTVGGEVWVGRCDDEDAERVILLDADVYPPAPEADGGGDGAPELSPELSPALSPALSKTEWLEKAARFGVWPRHRRVVLPRPRVAALRRLGDLA